jgi:DNA-binding NarL/FixJ family response regulator
MSAVPWTTEDDQELRSLARAGFSLVEIAQRMQRSKSSVRARATKLTIALARDRNSMQAPLKPPSASSKSA